jgi:hypothetical protein
MVALAAVAVAQDRRLVPQAQEIPRLFPLRREAMEEPAPYLVRIMVAVVVVALLQQDLLAAVAPEETAEMARARPFLAAVLPMLAVAAVEFMMRAQPVLVVLAAVAQAAVLLLEPLEPLIPAAVVVEQEERFRQQQMRAAQAVQVS